MRMKEFLNKKAEGQIGLITIIFAFFTFIILSYFTPVGDATLNLIIPQLNASNSDALILVMKAFMPTLFLAILISVYLFLRGGNQNQGGLF